MVKATSGEAKKSTQNESSFEGRPTIKKSEKMTKHLSRRVAPRPKRCKKRSACGRGAVVPRYPPFPRLGDVSSSNFEADADRDCLIEIVVSLCHSSRRDVLAVFFGGQCTRGVERLKLFWSLKMRNIFLRFSRSFCGIVRTRLLNLFSGAALS